jgi:peroxiredoxin
LTEKQYSDIYIFNVHRKEGSLTSRKITVLSTLFSVAVIVALLSGAQQVSGAGGPKGSDFQFFKNRPDANNFQMGVLDGKVVSLSDYKGKVVLLNFWRKDCPYCDMEKNHLSAMLRSFGNANLEVLCVNLWDDPSWVRAYATRSRRPFTIASRAGGRRSVVENVVNGRTMGYYVLNGSNEAIYEVKGFPSTYVIDKRGKVVATHMGLAPWSVPPVMRWLSELLGEGADTPAERGSDLPEWLDRLLGGGPSGKASEQMASHAAGR